MRKRLSSGQKWFLKPYFPLIRGMFVFRSGLRFLFRALEVPEPRVRKRPLSLTNRAFSSLSVRALPVPKRKSKTTIFEQFARLVCDGIIIKLGTVAHPHYTV